MRRFAEPEEFLRIRADREHSGSFNSVANAAIDRFGNTRASFHMDAAGTGETRISRRENGWRGRNDPGGERRDAIDRSAGDGRKLQGISREACKRERD